MSDYKSSLNLPYTEFPMKANLSNREVKFLSNWQDKDLYKQIRDKFKDRKKFILHDGPPYANGDIHIGHAVNKILKDIIVKSKTLSNFDAPYVPGWDCHGLPIEHNVEKKKGKAGHKISKEDFRQACSVYADKQIEKQKIDFKRLGILGEWDNPYLTKNFKYEADIVRALGKIVKNGHLSKGYKPVHWCTECQSALAEAEVEYKDKQSDAIYVAFRITDSSKFITNNKPLAVVIWTTTPWTLPANEAVAINAELDYVIIECEDFCYIVASDLQQSFIDNIAFEKFDIKKNKIKSESLNGLMLQHPFIEKQVPIIIADHVTTDAGTGAVHTAPAHGQEDYIVGLDYDLPINCPVDAKGVFYKEVEYVGGEFIFKANTSIIELLKSKNNLVYNNSISHSYPHCWRHKTALIFRATSQWFVSMTKKNLKDTIKKEIENVTWIPKWGEKRIELMIENRPDWCISRQRFWGAPITLFVHKKTAQLHPNTDSLFEIVAKKIEKEGINAWFNLKIEDILGKEATEYEKTTDTLDVWFDSGVSHFAVLQDRDYLAKVADLYLEGSDQHRGWFQSSIITSCAINGKSPYRQVLTHGFIVDQKGHKMSKSLGNVVSPQKIVNSLGADVLRLWIGSTDYSAEMSVSDEILKRSADSYRRIRNTARFMLANMQGFDPQENLLNNTDMLSLDRWMVAKTAKLQKYIITEYEKYNFHHIMKEILNFCTNDLGGFYLDIIKDRQYTTQTSSIARLSAQSAIYHICSAMVRWLAPILSFTAEEIYRYMPAKKENSIFLETWYDNLDIDYSNKSIDIARNMNIHIRKRLEDMRKEKHIGSSLDAEIDIYCDGDNFDSLKKLEAELRFIFITSDARVHKYIEKSKDAIVISDNVAIVVNKSLYKKCTRCWHHRQDCGDDKKYLDLCSRCIENVAGEGEKRVFA